MTFLRLTIPLVPPGVNMYKRTCRGRYFVTPETLAFKEAVSLLAHGQALRGERYAVAFTVYLGKGGRGDADNFAKVIQDALVDAGVIDSDARVFPTICNKGRDTAQPRTEIAVAVIPKSWSLVEALDLMAEFLR